MFKFVKRLMAVITHANSSSTQATVQQILRDKNLGSNAGDRHYSLKPLNSIEAESIRAA